MDYHNVKLEQTSQAFRLRIPCSCPSDVIASISVQSIALITLRTPGDSRPDVVSVIPLPCPIDPDLVTASFADGYLELTLRIDAHRLALAQSA